MALLEEIRRRLSFLFDCGFSVLESDDWTTVLVCREVLLRITHDRADWFVDVSFSSFPDQWYELWDVLSLLDKKGLLKQSYRSTNKLSGVGSALKANLGEIMDVEKYKDAFSLLATKETS